MARALHLAWHQTARMSLNHHQKFFIFLHYLSCCLSTGLYVTHSAQYHGALYFIFKTLLSFWLWRCLERQRSNRTARKNGQQHSTDNYGYLRQHTGHFYTFHMSTLHMVAGFQATLVVDIVFLSSLEHFPKLSTCIFIPILSDKVCDYCRYCDQSVWLWRHSQSSLASGTGTRIDNGIRGLVINDLFSFYSKSFEIVGLGCGSLELGGGVVWGDLKPKEEE